MHPYRVGFVIEQSLGHVTHGQNVAAVVAQDPTIQAFWALPAFEVSGIASHLPLYRSNWTLRAGLRARRMLKNIYRESPLDVLFFHTQVVATLASGWMRGTPSVVSLDATPRQMDRLGAHYQHAVGPRVVEDLKWRMTRNCFREAKHLITWSQWAADGLVEEYEVPPEKITVIPPGILPEKWLRPTRQATDESTVKILFVGGDFQRKGGPVLLEAFRRFYQELKYGAIHGAPGSIELHLVTREKLPEEAGVFIYNDMSPNSPALIQLYFDCDVFCLPTQGDCLPLALAEASAAGLPVISTRVGAIPELIKDCETGLLVQPGDTDALYAALRSLVMSPEMRLKQGLKGEAFVREKHNAEKNVWQLVHLLKQVADGRTVQEKGA